MIFFIILYHEPFYQHIFCINFTRNSIIVNVRNNMVTLLTNLILNCICVCKLTVCMVSNLASQYLHFLNNEYCSVSMFECFVIIRRRMLVTLCARRSTVDYSHGSLNESTKASR